MSAPRQMTANTLNALKGWPSQSALDFTAEFASSIPAIDLPVLAGSVVSLNSSGQYIVGVGTTAVMPLFLFASSDDPDVMNETPAANTKDAYIAINPTGKALSLVATGAYELVSTAYVVGGGNTYSPNAFLTANLSGAANPGKLRVGTRGTDMCVGMVSRGVVNNGYGNNAVAFWPIPVFPDSVTSRNA